MSIPICCIYIYTYMHTHVLTKKESSFYPTPLTPHRSLQLFNYTCIPTHPSIDILAYPCPTIICFRHPRHLRSLLPFRACVHTQRAKMPRRWNPRTTKDFPKRPRAWRLFRMWETWKHVSVARLGSYKCLHQR